MVSSNRSDGQLNDNSYDNLSYLQSLTLTAVHSQHSLSSISLSIDRNKSNTHRTLLKLVEKGLVERMGSHYILTGRGLLVLKSRELSSIDSPLNKTTFTQPVSAHNVSFNVLLWNVPDGWEKWLNTCCGLHLPEEHQAYPKELRRVARKWGVNKEMKGWEPVDITLFNGFSFRVHPKGVLVHIPEIVSDKPSVASKIAIKRLVSILPKLERWLKLTPTSLYKQGRLNIKLVSSHFALFEHEFSKWWVTVEGRGREEFMVRGDDGNLLLYMDNSPQFSLETSDPVKGELASDWVQEYFRPIAEGRALRPDEVRSRVERTESVVSGLNDLLSREAVLLEERLEVDRSLNLNMASHIALTREVAQAGREINEAMVVMRKVLYPLTVLGRFFSLVGDVLTKTRGGSFGGLLHRGRRSDG